MRGRVLFAFLLVLSASYSLRAQGRAPLPDLVVSITDSPDPVIAGNNITYTLTVTNVGGAEALNVSVADFYPPGLYYLSFTAPTGWTTFVSQITDLYAVGAQKASLAPGESGSFTFVLPVPATLPGGTVVTNSAAAESLSVETTRANNHATATTLVMESPLADLVVTNIASPAPVAAGNHNITYSISVTDDGQTPASQVALTDVMPAGTSFVSFTAPPGWTVSTPPVDGNGTVTATIPSLPARASATFVLVVSDGVIGVTATVKNTAVVTTSSTEKTTENNSATASSSIVDARVAVLSLKKTADHPAVAPGDLITYTMLATNSGPGVASDVKLIDQLPAGMSFVFSTPSQGSCSGSSTVTCSLGPINAGATATIILAVKGPASATTITNMATLSGNDTWTQGTTAWSTVQVSAAIPTLSPLLLALLAALLAAVAVRLLTE